MVRNIVGPVFKSEDVCVTALTINRIRGGELAVSCLMCQQRGESVEL